MCKIALPALLLFLSAACSRTPQQQAAKFIVRGKALLEKKDYTRAVLELKSAARVAPKDAEANYQLGLAYLAAGDIRTAGAYLMKATELDPKHVAAQVKIAELMSGSRNPEDLAEAEKRSKAVLEMNPDQPDALSTLATVEYIRGKPADAQKHLESVLEKFPQNLRASRTLALVKISRKDFAGAEQVLKHAVAQSPKSPEAEVGLGSFYLLLKRTEDAEAAYHRALKLDPKYAPALLDLLIVQRAKGRKPEIEQTLIKLSSLPDPQYKPLHAMFRFEQGDYDGALKEFTKLAKDDPNDRAARTRLVRAYLALNRLPEAMNFLAGVLKKNPRDADALIERSRIYLIKGRYEEARIDLEQVLRYKPDSAEAHFLLAKAYQNRGQPLTYRQELSQALRLNPRMMGARVELAESLRTSGSASAALELLNKAPEDQHQLIPVIVERNWGLLTLGDLAALRQSIDAGLAIQKAPDLLYQDGLLRVQMKDVTRGRASLEQALAANPEDTRALDILVKIYVSQNQRGAALEKIRQQVARKPDSAQLQYYLGRWLASADDRAGARKAFAAALAANPKFTVAATNAALVEIADGKPGIARQMLTAASTMPLGQSPSEVLLGTMDEKDGNIPAAIAHYRVAVEADPNNIVALNNLAYLLANSTGQQDEAIRHAQRAKELDPGNSNIDDTIGWAFYQKGIYQSAVKYLESPGATQTSPVRTYHLAMAYFRTGDRRRGQVTLAEALKMDPSLPEAKLAVKVMQEAASQANARPNAGAADHP